MMNVLFVSNHQAVQEDSTGGAVCLARGTQNSVTAELHVNQETSGATSADMPGNSTSHDVREPCCSKGKTYPLLSELAISYLCVQASSTPSERVLSTAGDTICPEHSRILPEKADMIIVLNKNCS